MGDHVIHRLQWDPGAGGKRHRFGGNGDVHPGQQLMDNFYRRAKTNVAPDAVGFAGHGVQHRREAGKGGIAPGGHHRHVAGGRFTAPPDTGASSINSWYSASASAMA